MEQTVYFLCNGQNPKCKDECQNSECMHTTDPHYAVHFQIEKDSRGEEIVIEKTPADRIDSFVI